jgi:hypothetical protein
MIAARSKKYPTNERSETHSQQDRLNPRPTAIATPHAGVPEGEPSP